MIDLHVHSTKSDGTYTPAELSDYASQKGLSAYALTDHDTIDGIDEAILQSKAEKNSSNPVKVIPGIELSTEYYGKDVHVVGLDIDISDPSFNAYLMDFKASRFLRNKKMCQKLAQAGIDISMEKMEAEYPDATLTRGNYARYMLNHGYIKTMKEAFDKYIGTGCPCYVPREKISPNKAVELILSCKGIPILAHPVLYHMGSEKLDSLVSNLKDCGLVGIEAMYSTYSPADERDIRALADKYELLLSGGSDFHGTNKPAIDLGVGKGRLNIPDEILEKLLQWKGINHG